MKTYRQFVVAQHFYNEPIRSNLNFFFVIISILTLIKSYHPDTGNSHLCFTIRSGGIKHRFSEHVMADISHSFYFLSFAQSLLYTSTTNLTKRCQNDVSLRRIGGSSIVIC